MCESKITIVWRISSAKIIVSSRLNMQRMAKEIESNNKKCGIICVWAFWFHYITNSQHIYSNEEKFMNYSTASAHSVDAVE